jgi:hypothetical protein
MFKKRIKRAGYILQDVDGQLWFVCQEGAGSCYHSIELKCYDDKEKLIDLGSRPAKWVSKEFEIPEDL